MSVNWSKQREEALLAVRTWGVIFVGTDVTKELAEIVIECVQEAMRLKLNKLTVLIDSVGGDSRAGIGIANFLSLASANGVEVTGLVLSRAYSSAFMILQSCKIRGACRGASLMMHWGQFLLINVELNAIMKGEESWVLEQIRNSRLEMLAIFASRSGLDEESLRLMCEREETISPEKALCLNLLTTVVDASDFRIPMPVDSSSS